MWVTLCIFFKVRHSWDKSHITQMSRLGQCPFPLCDHWDPRPSAGCFLSMALKCVSCYKHTWLMSFMVVWGIQSPWLMLWRDRAMDSWAEGPCLPPEPRPWCSSGFNIETFLKPTNFCIWFLRSMWCLSEIDPTSSHSQETSSWLFLKVDLAFLAPPRRGKPSPAGLNLTQQAGHTQVSISSWSCPTRHMICGDIAQPGTERWQLVAKSKRRKAQGIKEIPESLSGDISLGQSRGHRNGSILRGWSLSPAAFHRLPPQTPCRSLHVPDPVLSSLHGASYLPSKIHVYVWENQCIKGMNNMPKTPCFSQSSIQTPFQVYVKIQPWYGQGMLAPVLEWRTWGLILQGMSLSTSPDPSELEPQCRHSSDQGKSIPEWLKPGL